MRLICVASFAYFIQQKNGINMRNASPRNCASITVYYLHLQAPHDRCTRYVELWLEKRMPSSRVFAKGGTMIERSSEPEETEKARTR